MPTALKIFLCSLLTGVGFGWASFRVAVFLAMKFIDGEHAMPLAMLIGALSALTVGGAAAITAGVMMGKSAKA